MAAEARNARSTPPALALPPSIRLRPTIAEMRFCLPLYMVVHIVPLIPLRSAHTWIIAHRSSQSKSIEVSSIRSLSHVTGSPVSNISETACQIRKAEEWGCVGVPHKVDGKKVWSDSKISRTLCEAMGPSSMLAVVATAYWRAGVLALLGRAWLLAWTNHIAGARISTTSCKL